MHSSAAVDDKGASSRSTSFVLSPSPSAKCPTPSSFPFSRARQSDGGGGGGREKGTTDGGRICFKKKREKIVPGKRKVNPGINVNK